MEVKRAIIIIGLAASLVVAGGATASAETPFRGTFTGVVTATPCGVATLCLEGTLTGTATQLGRATLTKSAVLHITSVPCAGGIVVTFTETVTLTAANGDTLELTGTGSTCTGGGQSVGSAALTVTSGSGRFALAAGTIDEQLVHDLASDAETTVLTGTISSPGGGR